MAPTTIIAAPVSIVSTTSGSRSRPQARKKPSDDAAYFGPPGGIGTAVGVKRHAAEKAEGEPRVKRKRAEAGTSAGARKSEREKERERDRLALSMPDGDTKMSLVKFYSMPMAALHRYLVQFDLVPMVYPSPLTIEDPPPPGSLEHTMAQSSRGPTPTLTTPANRPRRESKESRRRSSRLVEEEAHSRVPVLADVEEIHKVLAVIAERHFREHNAVSGREEVDILAGFMCKIKKGTRL